MLYSTFIIIVNWTIDTFKNIDLRIELLIPFRLQWAAAHWNFQYSTLDFIRHPEFVYCFREILIASLHIGNTCFTLSRAAILLLEYGWRKYIL